MFCVRLLIIVLQKRDQVVNSIVYYLLQVTVVLISYWIHNYSTGKIKLDKDLMQKELIKDKIFKEKQLISEQTLKEEWIARNERICKDANFKSAVSDTICKVAGTGGHTIVAVLKDTPLNKLTNAGVKIVSWLCFS